MKRCAPLLLLALLLCGGCSRDKATPAASAAAPRAEAAPAPASDTAFVTTGPVIVEQQVDVAALREGVVAQLQGEPGAAVRKGQLLARLDDRQVASDLEAARAKARGMEADLRNWEAESKVFETDLERARKMWDAQLITKEQLEKAQYKVVSNEWNVKNIREQMLTAQAEARSLELELEKMHIRAPFGGVVARRYIRLGQRVAMGDRLFWVTATSPLRVKFTLPERYLGKVKKGEQVSVTAEAAPETRYAAKVVEVSPVVDPSSGTIEVAAELTGNTSGLLPGMTASIRLETAR